MSGSGKSRFFRTRAVQKCIPYESLFGPIFHAGRSFCTLRPIAKSLLGANSRPKGFFIRRLFPHGPDGRQTKEHYSLRYMGNVDSNTFSLPAISV